MKNNVSFLITDGRKKKRKQSSVGGLYSGVSVSQLLAQRERAIAAAVANANANNSNPQAQAQNATMPGSTSSLSNGSQVNN